MSNDLKQNIFYTVFFIFLHNFAAIFYLLGIVVAAILLLVKPTRWKTFLLFGFIILLFAFEYKKHIVEPLREQTMNSLITVRQHYKTERLVNITLTKILPLLLPLSGWALVAVGVIVPVLKLESKPKK